MGKVPSSFYDQKYFLSDCEGWSQWQKTRGRELSPRLRYAVSLVPVKKGMKILDFGCGRGEASFWAARQGGLVWAVDYSPTAARLFQKGAKLLPPPLRKRVRFKKIEGREISFKNNFFDLIYFFDVFEHLTDQELKVILKKFYLFLKPGGKLVVHTAPNKDFLDFGYPFFTRWMNILIHPFWRLIFKEGRVTAKNPRSDYDKKVHVNEQTVKTVEKWLQWAGFKPRVWLESRFHLIRVRDKIDYYFLRPIRLPFLKRFFVPDIWARGEK